MQRYLITPLRLSVLQARRMSTEVPQKRARLEKVRMSLYYRLTHSTAICTQIIGTHNGTFHCDEALAVFLLRQTATYCDAGQIHPLVDVPSI